MSYDHCAHGFGLPCRQCPVLKCNCGESAFPEQEVIGFAQIRLKGTQYISTSDDKGNFRLKAPAGAYTLMVSAFGYQTVEKSRVAAWATNKTKLDVTAKRK